MTESSQPQTAKHVQLDQFEWKALCINNLMQMQQWLQGLKGITDAEVPLIAQHIDKLHAFVRGCKIATAHAEAQRMAAEAAAKAAAEGVPTDPAPAAAKPASQGNGAAAPRKGGWPKGKKRTRQAAQPAVTQ